MLNPIRAGKFKREFRLMKKRHKDMAKLLNVMALITNEQPLPPHYEDHPLYGNYAGKRECHIEPNWLLIYEIDRRAGEVTFYRTGAHTDLFI
jgi:mRNA interferase YafQ